MQEKFVFAKEDEHIVEIDGKAYVVGAEGVQKFLKRYGIEKKDKATYKFMQKIKDKRRININGRSKIAVSLDELQQILSKNYPSIFENGDKNHIIRAFREENPQGSINFEDNTLRELEENLKKTAQLLFSVPPSLIAENPKIFSIAKKIYSYLEVCLWLERGDTD